MSEWDWIGHYPTKFLNCKSTCIFKACDNGIYTFGSNTGAVGIMHCIGILLVWYVRGDYSTCGGICECNRSVPLQMGKRDYAYTYTNYSVTYTKY